MLLVAVNWYSDPDFSKPSVFRRNLSIIANNVFVWSPVTSSHYSHQCWFPQVDAYQIILKMDKNGFNLYLAKYLQSISRKKQISRSKTKRGFGLVT